MTAGGEAALLTFEKEQKVMKKLKKLQKRASGADASGELAPTRGAPSPLSSALKLHRPSGAHAVAHMLYQLMESYKHAGAHATQAPTAVCCPCAPPSATAAINPQTRTSSRLPSLRRSWQSCASS